MDSLYEKNGQKYLYSQYNMFTGTKAEWKTVDPILEDGQPGFETDTNVFKVGDGVHKWTELAEAGGGGSRKIIETINGFNVVFDFLRNGTQVIPFIGSGEAYDLVIVPHITINGEIVTAADGTFTWQRIIDGESSEVESSDGNYVISKNAFDSYKIKCTSNYGNAITTATINILNATSIPFKSNTDLKISAIFGENKPFYFQVKKLDNTLYPNFKTENLKLNAKINGEEIAFISDEKWFFMSSSSSYWTEIDFDTMKNFDKISTGVIKVKDNISLENDDYIDFRYECWFDETERLATSFRMTILHEEDSEDYVSPQSTHLNILCDSSGHLIDTAEKPAPTCQINMFHGTTQINTGYTIIIIEDSPGTVVEDNKIKVTNGINGLPDIGKIKYKVEYNGKTFSKEIKYTKKRQGSGSVDPTILRLSKNNDIKINKEIEITKSTISAPTALKWKAYNGTSWKYWNGEDFVDTESSYTSNSLLLEPLSEFSPNSIIVSAYNSEISDEIEIPIIRDVLPPKKLAIELVTNNSSSKKISSVFYVFNSNSNTFNSVSVVLEKIRRDTYQYSDSDIFYTKEGQNFIINNTILAFDTKIIGTYKYPENIAVKNDTATAECYYFGPNNLMLLSIKDGAIKDQYEEEDVFDISSYQGVWITEDSNGNFKTYNSNILKLNGSDIQGKLKVSKVCYENSLVVKKRDTVIFSDIFDPQKQYCTVEDLSVVKTDLKNQIDGKIETYSTADDPSLNWSETEKIEHNGDIWYNTEEEKSYRYNGTAWIELVSSEARYAKNLAESKATIYTQKPTSYAIGSLWIVENDVAGEGVFLEGEMLTSIKDSSVVDGESVFSINDWKKYVKYKVGTEITNDINQITMNVFNAGKLTTVNINEEGLSVGKSDSVMNTQMTESAFKVKCNGIDKISVEANEDGTVETRLQKTRVEDDLTIGDGRTGSFRIVKRSDENNVCYGADFIII